MLNSKQRAYLRKLAQKEDAIFQIGKSGINENLIEQLKDALEKRELVKITLLDALLDTSDDDKIEIANTLASCTNSEIVHVLGKKITLYKKSTKKPKIDFSVLEESKTKTKTKSKAKSKAKLTSKPKTVSRAKASTFSKEKAPFKKDSKRFSNSSAKSTRQPKKSTSTRKATTAKKVAAPKFKKVR